MRFIVFLTCLFVLTNAKLNLRNVIQNGEDYVSKTYADVKGYLKDHTLDSVAEFLRKETALHTGADISHRGSDYLKNMCSDYACCQLGDANQCEIENMPKDQTTIVLTDKTQDGSQCIFGDTYGFQVIPGASDKVLFYFQGGGACWDKATTAAGMCTTTIAPNSPAGIFDRNNDDNPFKDYTIVHALYCSGDVWAGQHTASYTHQGQPVIQVGYDFHFLSFFTLPSFFICL